MFDKKKSSDQSTLGDTAENLNNTAANPKENEEVNISEAKITESEVNELREQLVQKENELKEYVDLAQRVKAEFDNFKKRTLREKEQLYVDITGDIISKFLPVIDNMERAVSSSINSTDIKTVVDGMEMVLRQFKDILAKEGLEEIEACGQEFDPNYHEAVMHVEDESAGSNTVVDVFQKGYKIKDKIVRHSMVKVAN